MTPLNFLSIAADCLSVILPDLTIESISCAKNLLVRIQDTTAVFTPFVNAFKLDAIVILFSAVTSVSDFILDSILGFALGLGLGFALDLGLGFALDLGFFLLDSEVSSRTLSGDASESNCENSSGRSITFWSANFISA